MTTEHPADPDLADARDTVPRDAVPRDTSQRDTSQRDAEARDAVLAAVAGFDAHGGLSLGPATLVLPPHWPVGTARLWPPQWRTGTGQTTTWWSIQDWTGPLADCVERRLVFVAIAAVERIANSPTWATPELADHRARLDLAGELDELDHQAHLLATLRPAAPAEELAHGWTTLVDRVAALQSYADRLTALSVQPGRIPAEEHRIGAMMTGAAGDELASARLRGLAEELGHSAVTGDD